MTFTIELPEQVSWSEIIDQLQAWGVSNSELAKRLHIQKSAITRLKQGSQPLASNAFALLKIYCEVHQKQLDEV